MKGVFTLERGDIQKESPPGEFNQLVRGKTRAQSPPRFFEEAQSSEEEGGGRGGESTSEVYVHFGDHKKEIEY